MNSNSIRHASLTNVSNALIEAKKRNLPIPVLNSMKDTRIAWEILENSIDIRDLVREKANLVLTNNLAEFSLRDLAPIMKLVDGNLSYDERWKLKENTEWVAWRQRQTLVKRSTSSYLHRRWI